MLAPIKKTKETKDKLTEHIGLELVGILIKSTMLKERLNLFNGVHLVNEEFSHSDILLSMLGLICIGRPNYEAIEPFRANPEFFTSSLGISKCPSAETLRQRLDLLGHSVEAILKEESARMLKKKAPKLALKESSCGQFVTLDIDVSPFDNSGTKKEGVSRTYKGYDGYAPNFAYLGIEGWLINIELRKGSQHCQKNTPEFIGESIRLARQMTSAPLLMRLDSGYDCKDNFPEPENDNVHFIIKRNRRRESPAAWLELAKNQGQNIFSSEEKKIWLGQTTVGLTQSPLPYTITFKITERHIDKKGQRLLIPMIDVETYWCSLSQMPPEEVIELYHEHGTSEQYHSEIKTDLKMERLPSRYFSTNSLMLHLTMLAYNILRIIGQQSLEQTQNSEKHLPGGRAKPVKRRRIKTIMQDLIFMAGRLIFTGRQCYIGLDSNNPFTWLWRLINTRLQNAAS